MLRSAKTSGVAGPARLHCYFPRYPMPSTTTARIHSALETFRIELPSWGFANTGTRFGKYLQPAAAATLDEKLSDAAQVHALTGACPTVAVHVQWDFPTGLEDSARVTA